jgi:hypothetical protein
MKKLFPLCILALATLPAFTQAQAQVVVQEFKSKVDFPYDLKQLQTQTVVELKKRNIPTADANGAYSLEGEILEWHAGNRATRLIVGFGSGRETAKIHFWLTDRNGKKVFEHTDTIRQSVWGGGYTPSAGQLVQPFAVKIAERVAESKVLKE